MNDCKSQYSLPVGSMVQEYRVAEVLGTGGFGIVYKAENKYFSEIVALKEFLPSDLACRPKGQTLIVPLSFEVEKAYLWARRKFLEEAKTLRELGQPDRHPNLVRVRQFIEAHGTAYMVMDFEKGRPLSQLLDERVTLPEKEVRVLLSAMLDGLKRVHGASVWHRDIKPSNILIRSDGSPVLIDFGAARKDVMGSDRSMISIFSPAYAAAEQIHPIGDQGPWTDIYALGATLYRAIIGVVPTNAAKRLQGETYRPATKAAPSYSPSLLNAIDAALELYPSDRPQSVSQWERMFAEDIRMDDDRTRIRPPTTAAPKKKQRSYAGLPAILVLIAVALVGLWTYRHFHPSNATDQEHAAARVKINTEKTGHMIAQTAGEHPPEATAGDSAVEGPTAQAADQAEKVAGRSPAIAIADTSRETTERTLAPDNPLPETAHLSVAPQPGNATIRIMNIEQRFTQAMALKPGNYKLSVSAPGFATVEQWIDLAAGEDRTVKIRLSKERNTITNSLGMRFQRIGAGTFMMGSPAGEPGRADDETPHRVTLTRSFFIQDTEVTVGQFKKFAKATGYVSEAETGGGCWIAGGGRRWHQKAGASWKQPGSVRIDDKLPVLCVTWNDVRAFARWLSKKEERTYRLPTEAEWEYAGRAATTTPFSTGRCLASGEANYARIGVPYQRCRTVFSGQRGRPVDAGQLAPNPWKLHDIHGNAAEWCRDWYGAYPTGNAVDPQGPQAGSERVMRGGHWQADAAECRSAKRWRLPPGMASDVVGFRLVMED
jgi:formylglycine-generating enzyme required for sulfatase activity/serine/threonine protein kinase